MSQKKRRGEEKQRRKKHIRERRGGGERGQEQSGGGREGRERKQTWNRDGGAKLCCCGVWTAAGMVVLSFAAVDGDGSGVQAVEGRPGESGWPGGSGCIVAELTRMGMAVTRG